MRTIIRSLHHDHRELEELLRILEQECDMFRGAEKPDYELLSEIVSYFRSFLDMYHRAKEDSLLDLVKTRNMLCAKIVDEIVSERASVSANLEALDDTLRDIRNEQRILRQTFDEAARNFIEHERRQIKLEEQQLFPAVSGVLRPKALKRLRAMPTGAQISPSMRQLVARLRSQRRWIVRAAMMERAARDASKSVTGK
jgi:hemerythrin-like domain-containing protein